MHDPYNRSGRQRMPQAKAGKQGKMKPDPIGRMNGGTAMTDQTGGRRAGRMTAGRAEPAFAGGALQGLPAAEFASREAASRERRISQILAETAAERADGRTKNGAAGSGTKASSRVHAEGTGGEAASTVQRRTKTGEQRVGQKGSSAGASKSPQKENKTQTKRRKKRKKHYTFKEVVKSYVPWRGDSLAESLRKIVFFAALCVVAVCTFLISNYYIGLYHDHKAYEEWQKKLEEARQRTGYSDEPKYETDPETGHLIEYLEMNELGQFLRQNPDLVGHISIEGTIVNYPVVQKRNADPNENTNEYYLFRNFQQESSKSGCIFMDFRCNFDRVADHKRYVDNSDNLVIYGHNMNDRSMFGSLRDYIRNINYYKEHPIVTLQSLYKTYRYKIFSAFIVDGMDFTSPYAFDCWNTIDFADENEFYEYVNNAKKRNIIENDVDVTYGDPILTLYTCSSVVPEGKLILMCRMVREDEKDNEKVGTENARMNDNVLYPESYYKNHDMTFDASKFVPYGPKKKN